jgi:hypothetical protein
MTINELANVHMGDVDNTTGERISHREKWQRVVNALGYEEVKERIPYTLEQIKKALPRDEYLNNLPMKAWDNSSGVWVNDMRGTRGILHGAPLLAIYRKAGVTSFSQSDGVCILKEAARMWAEEQA